MGVIIAIDPGGSTGVAVGSNVKGRNFDVIAAATYSFNNRFFIRDLITLYGEAIDQVVIEEFRLTSNETKMRSQINSDFPSVRVIGIVEAYMELGGMLNKLTLQTPAQRKNVTIPPDHMNILKHHTNHAQDAYRHLRYYILVNSGKR